MADGEEGLDCARCVVCGCPVDGSSLVSWMEVTNCEEVGLVDVEALRERWLRENRKVWERWTGVRVGVEVDLSEEEWKRWIW